MSWTDERVELLKKLWTDGLSASQIAKELGGVTRNAVIGKVHRLGLSGRTKGPSQSRVPGQKRAARPANYSQRPSRAGQRPNGDGRMRGGEGETRNAVHVSETIAAPESMKLILTQLTERTCKWPHGDPATADFHFCGHEPRDGGPYCAYHSLLAYQPLNDRKRDRRVEA